MNYLDALALDLQDGGFGRAVTTGAPGSVTIFAAPGPDHPIIGDNIIALYGRGGPIDETFTQEWGQPNVSILIRGLPNDTAGPETKAWAVMSYLNRIANMTVQTVPFIRVHANATPSYLQTDSSKRTEYTMDLAVWLG